MILDRLANGGEIFPEYRLEFIKNKINFNTQQANQIKFLTDFS